MGVIFALQAHAETTIQKNIGRPCMAHKEEGVFKVVFYSSLTNKCCDGHNKTVQTKYARKMRLVWCGVSPPWRLLNHYEVYVWDKRKYKFTVQY